MTSVMPGPPRLLRLSVTDRCNFRCRYCMPPEGVPKLRHIDILPLEELAELAQWLSAGLGIERIKLTGGEPLVRAGIPALISELRAIVGIREVSLTTNGSLLGHLAPALKAAGLARATISLDSLDPKRYHELTRGGDLTQTLTGIAAARDHGLTPIKLNAVLQRSTWQLEVPALLDYAAKNGFELRFIELMRSGTERAWCEREFVDFTEVRRWLAMRAAVVSLPPAGCAPARLTEVEWGGRRLIVGWIAPRSNPFCGSCDRLRVDARGRVHRCLMDRTFFDLAGLRRECGDAAAATALRSYLYGKGAPCSMDRAEAMSLIGG